MRYYFMNQEMKEFSIDVEVHAGQTMEFTHEGNKKKLEIRNLAGKYFYSFDGIAWKKLARLGVNETLVSNSEVYKVYRGFKPSGLNKGGAGALITQMPGKVVKLMKKEGDPVTTGETVLILEAMKMENEIKAGATGTIKAVNVKEGQALEAGFLMVEIEEG
jgi:biotin carboxyl carrier protein